MLFEIKYLKHLDIGTRIHIFLVLGFAVGYILISNSIEAFSYVWIQLQANPPVQLQTSLL